MARTDEKKLKKSGGKGRFNIIDLILLITVLACIAGIYLRYSASQDFGVKQQLDSFTLSFEVQNIRYTSADAFPSGDAVYMRSDDTYVGTILSLDSTSPTEYIFFDLAGNVKQTYYPENTRIDVTGKILSQGRMTENGFLLNGNVFVAPGRTYSIKTPHIDVDITITDITRIEEAG